MTGTRHPARDPLAGGQPPDQLAHGPGHGKNSEPFEPSARGLRLFAAVLAFGTVFGWLAGPLTGLPGNPVLYGAGLAAAAGLSAPFLFFAAKRGNAGRPRAWFLAHLTAGGVALPIAAFHAGGGTAAAPFLLLLLLAALVAQGLRFRLRMGPPLAARMGGRATAFGPGDEATRENLASLIERKNALLARIEPQAREALFSPLPRHWLRHPRMTWTYSRLARVEARLMGTTPPRARRLHILLGTLVIAGLLAHVFTVTFLAGYVAGGVPATWPHLTDWGGNRDWLP
jgi:hypothetical protein